MPFRIALSGLNAAQTDLSVTGNNIANASTAGFKGSRTEFSDVYAVAFEGISSLATGNGVAVTGISQNFSQGNIDFTERNLDLAVSGQGFFVLSDTSGQTFSRSGAFHIDRNGLVVNQGGQRLQVFPAITGGGFNTGTLSDVQLLTSDGPPQPTANINVTLNLSASDTVPTTVPFDANDPTSFNNSTSTVIFDSLGSAHTSTLYYVKSAVLNQWDTYQYIDGNEVTSGGVSPISITFNPDGTLAGPTSIAYDAVPSGTGALPVQVDVNYPSSTQFGSPFAVNGLSQDGFTTGRLSGIDIDNEGVVFARFTNGQSNPLGKVALASFANVGGLSQQGDTSWAQTFESGDLVLGEANTASFGLVQSGALEASNVDIASSLVNLITAQRNFQANAQVISAADTVTQTIINI
ncbi:MAG: flagellar hook protein FlgE [Ectothiorhodospiraceae bacterium]|nr:flagellar hook protein FlgE [Ectothiorhodospiraceae bacterium]